MPEDVAEQAWAFAELRDARLGDARLTRRLIRVTSTLSKNPEESIPSAFSNDHHAVSTSETSSSTTEMGARLRTHAG
jgi:hypothetical protein